MLELIMEHWPHALTAIGLGSSGVTITAVAYRKVKRRKELRRRRVEISRASIGLGGQDCADAILNLARKGEYSMQDAASEVAWCSLFLRF